MRGPISLGLDFLPYERIAAVAGKLLADCGRTEEIPVDVEMLVERDMGLDIIPIPGLRDLAGLVGQGCEGLTDGKAVYVDGSMVEGTEERLRLTLAHEVGHVVLHRQVFEVHRIASVTEWKDFMGRVDLRDYSRMEFQAHAFAGCLLVPRRHLEKTIRDALPGVEGMIHQARALGFGRGHYFSDAVEALADALRPTFAAPAGVLRQRIEKDGLDKLIP